MPIRRFLFLLPLGLLPSLGAAAQTACSATGLTDAGKPVATLRHELHRQAVVENDPEVPATIAAQLAQLKDALQRAADLAFTCASASATPDTLQTELAAAVHANLSGASESALLTRDGKDLGAYGSDLAVQVLPLNTSPSFFEVDFRYGIECGDDNLLLVYERRAEGWRPALRWDARSYRTVADAYGDFVLLTPLSGFPGDRNWRFVVAHGQPGCPTGTTTSSEGARPSRFALDLLEPTDDPAHPEAVWHLDRPYVRSETPRLSTTEDTLTFELRPASPGAGARPTHGGKAPSSGTAAAQSFRYRVTRDNQVEPLTGAPTEVAPSASTAHPALTAPAAAGSPQ